MFVSINIDAQRDVHSKMDLKLVLFSLILISVNFNLVQGYSCKFENKKYFGYHCELKRDDNGDVEQHLPNKTDDDVKQVDFDARRNWDDNSPLKSPTVNICQRFVNLNKIEVEQLRIEPNFLKACKNLKEFFTRKSDIVELTEDFLVDNRRLTSLKLRDNNWPTLPERLFANQKELEGLTLTNNQVKFLPKNIFKQLENLKYLYLSYNNIQSLDSELFKDLHNLKLLDLSNNELSDLPKNIFNSLDSLYYLSLDNNYLTTIHSDSFGNNNPLKIISLSWNKINAFDEKLIDSTSLDILDMYKIICTENLDSNDKVNIQLMKKRMKKCFENYQPRQGE